MCPSTARASLRAFRSTSTVLLISGAVAFSAFAVEPSTDSKGLAELSYGGKSAEKWIDQLRTAKSPGFRARAAKSLGIIAREHKQQFFGFSDVPVDLPEPDAIRDDALRTIVEAVTAGLRDADAKVRLASAEAVSLIGSRAASATPAVIRLLQDSDEEVANSAMTAVGRIGPQAISARSSLEEMLASADPQRQIDAAESLRLIGAPTVAPIRALINLLSRESSGGPGYYAGLELANIGDAATPALLEALKSKDANTRTNAAYAFSNMAGWGKLTADRERVADALIALSRDPDATVARYAAQGIGSVQAVPERSVPALVGLLKNADENLADSVIRAIGEFGAAAKPALPELIKKIKSSYSASMVIHGIGIDKESADAIRSMDAGENGSWLLGPLCEFPDAAKEFLERNPSAIDVPTIDREVIVRVLRDPDPRFKGLQEIVHKNEKLPLEIIAELGDSRFLPILEKRGKAASAHERTQIEACRRACGETTKQIVDISASNPGDFKPKSAWPDVDTTRIAPDTGGHGDGYAPIIITGQILRRHGGPATAPKFFRVNDSMLLGKPTNDDIPFKFDPKTGRFVFINIVFAAYSMGEGQPEPGPYQTGSCVVRIESEGTKPLEVKFFDEMPDVRITLPDAPKDPAKKL